MVLHDSTLLTTILYKHSCHYFFPFYSLVAISFSKVSTSLTHKRLYKMTTMLIYRIHVHYNNNNIVTNTELEL